MRKGILSLTLLLFSLTSCATILNGTRQSVGISSNPTNATVYIDGCYVGVSPVIVNMSRKNDHFVRLELPGYEPYEIAFTRTISGWVAGNLVFGGLIGLAVDALTGGIYVFNPKNVHADMSQESMVAKKGNRASYIAVVLKPDPSWTRIGQLAPRKSELSPF